MAGLALAHPRSASLLSGVLLGLAFPPLPCGFLAWVGLIPLLGLIDGGSPRRAFRLGYLQGLGFNLVAIYWIAYLTPLGALAAVLYLPLYVGLFVVGINSAIRRFGTAGLWGAPVLWTALEYIRSLGQLGFPWALLGNTQTGYLPLIQYAEWTGVYGVTFWVVAMNVAAVWALRTRPQVGQPAFERTQVGGGSSAGLRAGGWWVPGSCLGRFSVLALFAVPFAYGMWRIPAGPLDGSLRVGVVQPNRSPTDLWEVDGVQKAYETLFRMTREVAGRGARLVIWPETGAPTYLRTDARYRPLVQGLADSLRVSILTGAPDYDGGRNASYNSAFLFRPGGRDLARYDKMHLVPFGEAMPYGDLFPVLRKITFSASGFSSGDFSRGRDATLFEGPDGKFGVLICFEAVFPDLVRQRVRGGPDFLVTLTNDAWFGATSSPYQHAEIAVFRSVENRISMARCATTGISAFVDPYGRAIQRTGIFHPAGLVGLLPRRKGETFYTRRGDLFSQACVGLSLLGILAARRGSPTETRGI